MGMSGLQKRFEGDNHKLVVCEYTTNINCVNVTEIEYKIMNKKEHMHWFCSLCDAKVMKNLIIEQIVKTMRGIPLKRLNIGLGSWRKTSKQRLMR